MEHETLLSNQGDARDRDNEDYDQEQGEKPHSKAGLLQRRSRSRVTEIGVCICFCIIGLVIGFSGGRITGSAVATSNGQELSYTNTCTKPAIRREWRSLSIAERDAYIDSVFCLRSKPSKLNANQTLYDDFAFVHYQFNDEIHFAASFLSWHRYFIFIYHRTLVEECSYTNQLPYWDWTLDWEDITSSPVWDLEHGFSGNGRASSEPSPYFPRSHCVEEGRFGNLQVARAGPVLTTHCLTRDFGSGEPVEKLTQLLRPSAMEDLMQADDYFEFLLRFENGPHVAIPKFILGDFRLSTSPNDPIFFLHHSQVDRLWWQWQQYDMPRRNNMYTGSLKPKSEERASLDDMISLGGLAPDVKVSEIMDIRSGIFCYTY